MVRRTGGGSCPTASSRPISFAGYVVVQLACLVWQAVALIPVVRPGRDGADFSDLHQSLTVATVCGSWIFGVCPGAFLFMYFDVDVNSPPWQPCSSRGRPS
ncbi:UNVERIFIED_CONTAM: hypothetical protein RKD50_000796 [Streptomyces canus]